MKILEEEPPLANECKLPWLIDAFLYPISASGMIHLAVFVIVPLLISALIRFIEYFLGPYLGLATTEITEPVTIILGTFFLPMSLLRGIMFDAFDALNPIEIVRSIYRALLPYCGLVLFFFVVSWFIAEVLPRLPLWDFLKQALKVYLVFVLAHRLGWFYWWYKDKLDWGL